MKRLNCIPALLLSVILPLIWLSSCASTPAAGSGKPVILVVSFGTSYRETREKTIEAVEKAMTAAYPDYEIRRAFTSQTIINILSRRDGIKIDNVDEAMKRLVKDKVTDLIVQPTHVMNGFEYDDMMAEIKPYEKRFASIRYGLPLMISNQDFSEVTSALIENTRQFHADDTAVVFMGHGTEHDANVVYHRLDGLLKTQGNERYFIGTVEAEPSIEDIIPELHSLGVKKVVLMPFMIVAGDHANNDMAGDDEDSWKSILEGDGFTATAVLRGLGEYPEIQKIFVRHAGEAIGL